MFSHAAGIGGPASYIGSLPSALVRGFRVAADSPAPNPSKARIEKPSRIRGFLVRGFLALGKPVARKRKCRHLRESADICGVFCARSGVAEDFIDSRTRQRDRVLEFGQRLGLIASLLDHRLQTSGGIGHAERADRAR